MNLRLLKHSVVTLPEGTVFDPEKYPRTGFKIFLGCSESFIIDMRKFMNNENISYDYFYSLDNIIIYYTRHQRDREIIFTKATDVSFVEKSIFDVTGNIDNLLSSTGFIAKRKLDITKEIKNCEDNRESYRRSLLETIDRIGELKIKLSNFEENYKKLLSQEMENDRIIFKFENVTAEDTCVQGEDIFLGDLKFGSKLNGEVTLLEGSEPRRTGYNEEAYHPHHLEAMICLGSQDADFREAIQTFNFDIARIILEKFATSYTSSDSAGKSWKYWNGEEYNYDEDDDEEMFYVPSRSGDYYEDEVRWSEIEGEYIHYEDAVWSDYHDTYLFEDGSVWSDYHDTYILENDAVELEDGRFVHSESDTVELAEGGIAMREDTVEFEGLFYYEENMLEAIDGELIPKSRAINSDELGGYVLDTSYDELMEQYRAENSVEETLETIVEDNNDVSNEEVLG